MGKYLLIIIQVLLVYAWIFKWTKKSKWLVKAIWILILVLFIVPPDLALIVCRNGCGLEGMVFSVAIVFLSVPAGLVLLVGSGAKLLGEISNTSSKK